MPNLTNPEEVRAVFKSILQRLKEHQAKDNFKSGGGNPIEREFHTAIIEAAQNKRPSKKARTVDEASDILTKEEFQELRKPFEKRAQAAWDLFSSTKKDIEKELRDLADTEEILPHPGSSEVMLESIYGGAYRSCGDHYSQWAAEIRAEEVGLLGIKADVRLGSCRDYEVFVFVEDPEVDVEILKRKRAFSLRDWVKACWRRGANPRVFQPFLPYGIEAKMGLDYYGRDLESVK